MPISPLTRGLLSGVIGRPAPRRFPPLADRVADPAGIDAELDASGEAATLEWSEEDVVRLHCMLLEDIVGLADPGTPLEEKFDTLRWVFTDPDKDDRPFSFAKCLQVAGCSPLSPYPFLGQLDVDDDLGRSLSPDPFDSEDKRPIMNFEKIERAGHVLYMCLDSLPDPSVASAIGALALADLAARAGMRYNLGAYRRISLFVDEVSNVINQPLIEILNKGAEGGIFTTCAMQTLADLAKRMGSEDAARMALGNLNNLIALRSKDRPTQDFVVETFGKTAIHTLRVGLSHGADAHLGDFSAGQSTQIAESFEEMVPADVLGKLPNLQYFASVSGGRIIKGRFPILDTETPPAMRRARS